jgi:hypothetical protein
MTHQPFINKNYWTQETLFEGGFREVVLSLTIRMNGPLNLRSASAWITTEDSEKVLEATVPFYRDVLTDLPGLLVAIEDCLIETETYVIPF